MTELMYAGEGDEEPVADEDLLPDMIRTGEGSGRAPRSGRSELAREGQLLAGKYPVERIVGRRGSGMIVEVRHPIIGRTVVLKYLTHEACRQPEAVARFFRGARAALQMQSEHVARVIDVGRLESGSPYLVTEYLRGTDLAQVMRVRGELPVAEAVGYIVQACEGLAEAQTLGVVHRSLCPATLFLTQRPDGSALVKIVDFGISEALSWRPFSDDAENLEEALEFDSPLPYVSPEQIRTPDQVDQRADVWALGAILHELLTANRAFRANTVPGLLAAISADHPISLRQFRADAPLSVENVILRCLDKDPASRYASVGDLATALRTYTPASEQASIDRTARILSRSTRPPPLPSMRPIPTPPPAPPTSRTVVMPSVPAQLPTDDGRQKIWNAVAFGALGVSFAVLIVAAAIWRQAHLGRDSVSQRASSVPTAAAGYAPAKTSQAAPASAPSAVPSLVPSAAATGPAASVARATRAKSGATGRSLQSGEKATPKVQAATPVADKTAAPVAAVDASPQPTKATTASKDLFDDTL